MSATKIELNKTYRTRSFLGVSSDVRVFMVDGGTEKPVIGAYHIEEDGTWQLGRWTAEGLWFSPNDLESGESSLDLVEADTEGLEALRARVAEEVAMRKSAVSRLLEIERMAIRWRLVSPDTTNLFDKIADLAVGTGGDALDGKITEELART